MFNYTSTTIINSDKDLTTGKPLWVVGTKTSMSEGNGIPEHFVQIKRLATFNPANVISITKAAPEDEKAPTATVVVPTPTQGDIYRLAIYIGLSGSENSYYANDFVYKGKPFYIEAKAANSTASTLATDLVKNAKKFITMVYEKELVHLEASEANITITGIDGFLQFRKVELQHWVPAEKEFASTTGEWEVLKDTEANSVVAGEPGFGTYKHLMHNYILPTGANLRYEHIIQDEVPVIGGKYTQYILRMSTNRGVMGGAAVGQPVQSITTHCFWVLNGTVLSTFETAIANLNTVVTVDKNLKTKEAVEIDDIASKKDKK